MRRKGRALRIIFEYDLFCFLPNAEFCLAFFNMSASLGSAGLFAVTVGEVIKNVNVCILTFLFSMSLCPWILFKRVSIMRMFILQMILHNAELIAELIDYLYKKRKIK